LIVYKRRIALSFAPHIHKYVSSLFPSTACF